MAETFSSDETADIDEDTSVDLIEDVGSVTRTREGDPLADIGFFERTTSGTTSAPLGGPSGVSGTNRTEDFPRPVDLIEGGFRTVGEFSVGAADTAQGAAGVVSESFDRLTGLFDQLDTIALIAVAIVVIVAAGQLFDIQLGDGDLP